MNQVVFNLLNFCELCCLSSAVDTLCNSVSFTQVYQKLTREWPKDDSPYAVFMNNSKALYEDALISLRNPDPPPEFEGKLDRVNNLYVVRSMMHTLQQGSTSFRFYPYIVSSPCERGFLPEIPKI